MKSKHTIRKADLGLLAACLLIGLLLMLYLNLTSRPGAVAKVLVNGKEIAEFPLDKDCSYMIESDRGDQNKLIIYDGMAFFEDANCPDRLCVLQGTVSKDKESIVCLPHGVIVEIHERK